MAEEREVKLAASPSFKTPALDDIGNGIVAAGREPERLQTVYLDTDDLRLTRWAVSLRHRAGEGWTLKLPADGSGDLLVRTELVFDGDVRSPPDAAVDLVRAYVRTGQLSPQVRLRTVRRGVDVRAGDGQLLANLVDDEVSVLEGRRVGARFRELEVEATEETPAGLIDRIVDLLRANGAGAPDPVPKVVRALGERAPDDPEVAVGKLGRKATAGDAVRRAIAASVVRLIRHDVVVRLDADPEGVHQARVATRRLRSDLRTFAPLVAADWSRELREELGWLADALGRVRDGDVMLERLNRRLAELPEPAGRDAEPLLAALRGQRQQAFADLLDVLASDRYLGLLDRCVEAAQEPPLVGEAELSAAEVLPALVKRPWRKLEQAVGELSDPPVDEDLHQVRIQAKRCRYAAEAVAPAIGKRAKTFAARVADLQEVLGDHNDAVVAEAWLREWGLGAESPAAIFAAGELAGLERAAAAATRTRWGKAWKRLAPAKLRAWM